MSRMAAEIRQGPSFTDVWLKLAKRREIDPLFSPDGPATWQANTCDRQPKQSETRIPGDAAAFPDGLVLSADSFDRETIIPVVRGCRGVTA